MMFSFILRIFFRTNIFLLTRAEFCAKIHLFTVVDEPRGGVTVSMQPREWAVGESPVIETVKVAAL